MQVNKDNVIAYNGLNTLKKLPLYLYNFKVSDFTESDDWR